MGTGPGRRRQLKTKKAQGWRGRREPRRVGCFRGKSAVKVTARSHLGVLPRPREGGWP